MIPEYILEYWKVDKESFLCFHFGGIRVDKVDHDVEFGSELSNLKEKDNGDQDGDDIFHGCQF